MRAPLPSNERFIQQGCARSRPFYTRCSSNELTLTSGQPQGQSHAFSHTYTYYR